MLKPDYLDLDKDGNKTESMKEAVKDREPKYMGGMYRTNKEEGGSLLSDDMPMHTMPDGTEMPGATHNEYEQSMSSDSEMEDDYVDFLMKEALDEKEIQFLNEQLESNDKLSVIFDKVIDVASEFSGEGPVEGPGTGVSDSIPARLSDGEFVFTAKAVEEIGADNLEAIMMEAESNADQRQGMATGGIADSGEEEINANVQSKTVVLDRGFVPDDEDLVGDEIKKRMMDPSTQSRYVRS